jgi:hypothetical protein
MRLPRARVHGAPNAAPAAAAAAAASAGGGTAAGAHEHAAVLLSGRIARETAASFTGAKRARLSRIFAQLVEAGAMGATIRRAALVGVVPLRPRGVVLDFKVTMGGVGAAAAAAVAAGAFVDPLANGDSGQAAAAAAAAAEGAGGGGGGAAAEKELADAQDRQADERSDASAVAALLGGADFGSELKARFESRMPEIDTRHAAGGATDESGRHFAPVERGGGGGAAAAAAATAEAEAEAEGAEASLLLHGALTMGEPVVSVPQGWAVHGGQEGARGGGGGGGAAVAASAALLAGDPHHLTWQARKTMLAELQAEMAAAGGASTWQQRKHLEEVKAELAATARAPTAAPALAALGGGGASAERAAVERRWRTVALSLLLGLALCSGCLTLYKAQLERQRGRLQSRRTRRQRDAKRFGKSWWGVKNQPPPPPSRLGSATMRAEDASNCQAGVGSLFLTELVRRLTGGGGADDDDDGGEGGRGRRRSSRRWSRRRRSSDEWSD